MNRIRIILIFGLFLLMAGVAALGYRQGQQAVQMGLTGPYTNDVYYYEDGTPKADPAIVGIWQNAHNPQSFKVFYDDYNGDGYWWGKQWSEDEDVHEEDLLFHGNGWFLWRREGKLLTELHKMDISEATVPKLWRLKTMKDSLVLTHPDFKHLSEHFGRVHEEE